jgi:hypothetical protein
MIKIGFVGVKMKGLSTNFAERKAFFSNRSSAIFPLLFSSFHNDFHLVFLNYWNLKNNINTDAIVLNIRIYSTTGELVERTSTKIGQTHNQISLRSILTVEKFEGMLEVEFISTSNIGFTFPAVLGVYQTGDLYSCVHSAGRIKNSDEAQQLFTAEETNWTCKFSKKITPFFHIFCGPSPAAHTKIDDTKVILYSSIGEVLEEQLLKTNDFKPFQSKLYFANKIFDKKNLNNGNYISVVCKHGAIFPRLVVGNYYSDLGHMEVTHSFAKVTREDYCPEVDDDSSNSIINCYSDIKLDLSCKIFPTNCNGSFNGAVYSQKHNANRLEIKALDKVYVESPITEMSEIHLESVEKFVVLHLSGDKVPSRINTSFRYTVKGVNSHFSTDIATGAKSIVYPPKYRHWGHGAVGKGYQSIILIRNNSHSPDKTKEAKGELQLYSDNANSTYKFCIDPESAITIDLNSVLKIKNKDLDQNLDFLSWLISINQPNCETFWLVFREKDGAIWGEHGF